MADDLFTDLGDWFTRTAYPLQGLQQTIGQGINDWFSRAIPSAVTAVRGSSALQYAGSGLAAAGGVSPQTVGGQTVPKPQTVQSPYSAVPTRTTPPGAPMLGDQTSAFLAQANAQRQAFVDAQNRAIKAAGRGAGAPYAAEIARLDQAIATAQRDLGNVGSLFNNKIAESSAWWDKSITNLGTSYDDAIARSQLLQAEGRTAVDAVYSNSQAKVLSSLANVPGMDEASKIAAVETIGTLENAIMSMVDVSAEGQRNVMQASETLAVALAKQSKAKTNLEFVRERITIEESIKGEINNMLEQRKAASRAQAAAMSAARAEAAARLPDNWAFDQTSLAHAVGGSYLERAMAGYGDNIQQIVFDTAVEMYQNGLDYNGALTYLKSMDTTGMSWEVISALKKYLPLTLQAFSQGADQWSSYVGQDPNQYDINSAEYAYAVAANNSWMSEEEKYYTITNPGSSQSAFATSNIPQGSTTSSTKPASITFRGDVR